MTIKTTMRKSGSSFTPYDIVITVSNAVEEDVVYAVNFMETQAKKLYEGDAVRGELALNLMRSIRALINLAGKP